MKDRLSEELDSFSSIWQGGYYEGDPLDPMTPSTYGQLGYMSTLHATYLACIKPYVDPETVVFEIGPGRGAWTKTMLNAAEIQVVDALSAEHNGFFEYVGDASHVAYRQVHDFALDELPDDHFTYMFSFGALCHVSFEGITQYARSSLPKMRSGSHCFWMVADYAKYNASVQALPQLSPWSRCRLPNRRKYRLVNQLLNFLAWVEPPAPVVADPDDLPRPGRWYDAGTDRTCSMLESAGYRVIDRDVGVSHRDAVIHFVKD